MPVQVELEFKRAWFVRSIRVKLKGSDWNWIIWLEGGKSIEKKVHEQVVWVDTSTLNVIFFVAGLDKEIIIPANEEWIDNIDTQEKIINFSLPEGIVDLN